MNDFDVILAGGGLANGLIALVLAAERPEVRVGIFEAGPTLGGAHTWSFHGTDISADDHALIAPMVRASWPGQTIAFPDLQRTLTTPYHAITSDDFHRIVAAAAGPDALFFGAAIAAVAADRIVLSDGAEVRAPCVIDGRGWNAASGEALALAYQKFTGLEVELAAPHGLKLPTIMDATIAQTDGYRFMYCLPFGPRRMLIEDTYYATTPDMDKASCAAEIERYAEAKGWQITRVVRREAGCLPIVLAGGCEAFLPADGARTSTGTSHETGTETGTETSLETNIDAGLIPNGGAASAPIDVVPASGMRGGMFHPTTGYSLPSALKLARLIASIEDLTSAEVVRAAGALLRAQWQSQGFYRLLNRLLFVAARGEERRRVMQRFYRLPQDKIERFYAGQSTSMDRLRILSGWPPIPLPRAIAAVPVQSGWAHAAAGKATADRTRAGAGSGAAGAEANANVDAAAGVGGDVADRAPTTRGC